MNLSLALFASCALAVALRTGWRIAWPHARHGFEAYTIAMLVSANHLLMGVPTGATCALGVFLDLRSWRKASGHT